MASRISHAGRTMDELQHTTKVLQDQVIELSIEKNELVSRQRTEETRQASNQALQRRLDEANTTMAKLSKQYDEVQRRLAVEVEQSSDREGRLARAEALVEALRAKLTETEERAEKFRGDLRDAAVRHATVQEMERRQHARTVAEKDATIARLETELANAKRGNQELYKRCEDQMKDIMAYRALNGTGGSQNPDVVHSTKRENIELQARLGVTMASVDKLTEDLEGLKRVAFRKKGERTRTAGGDDKESAGSDAEGAIVIPVSGEVAEKLAAAEKERDKLREQNRLLKTELSAFGPEFFDELEDLKVAHHDALKILHQYRHWLSLVSRRYGIQFPLMTVGGVTTQTVTS